MSGKEKLHALENAYCQSMPKETWEEISRIRNTLHLKPANVLQWNDHSIEVFQVYDELVPAPVGLIPERIWWDATELWIKPAIVSDAQEQKSLIETFQDLEKLTTTRLPGILDRTEGVINQTLDEGRIFLYGLKAVPMLCYQLLFNADVIIQSNVEEILVNLDDLFARSIVTCHLENDKVNQDEIIILLGTLKSKDSLGLITNKITDKNLTDTVLWAFGTIGAAESIPEIMKFLGDEAHGFEAAIAISRMEHQEKTIPLLLNALDEPNETLKKNAAYALFSIAIEYKRMPVERLIQHLNNKSPEVREYMALALGEIGDPQALEALKKAAKDKNRAVREAASRAILEIMGE